MKSLQSSIQMVLISILLELQKHSCVKDVGAMKKKSSLNAVSDNESEIKVISKHYAG